MRIDSAVCDDDEKKIPLFCAYDSDLPESRIHAHRSTPNIKLGCNGRQAKSASNRPREECSWRNLPGNNLLGLCFLLIFFSRHYKISRENPAFLFLLETIAGIHNRE
jgi:hypothetical protein